MPASTEKFFGGGSGGAIQPGVGSFAPPPGVGRRRRPRQSRGVRLFPGGWSSGAAAAGGDHGKFARDGAKPDSPSDNPVARQRLHGLARRSRSGRVAPYRPLEGGLPATAFPAGDGGRRDAVRSHISNAEAGFPE
ncbi:hypothetical protein SDC9_122630 [bioreactor metagenome]|uniref:Uncharacterized protein n=1 Tax=bioreactor metagenome TaxID=1076179 RepID=A0A645CF83_9ZZZZ